MAHKKIAFTIVKYINIMFNKLRLFVPSSNYIIHIINNTSRICLKLRLNQKSRGLILNFIQKSTNTYSSPDCAKQVFNSDLFILWVQ